MKNLRVEMKNSVDKYVKLKREKTSQRGEQNNKWMRNMSGKMGTLSSQRRRSNNQIEITARKKQKKKKKQQEKNRKWRGGNC